MDLGDDDDFFGAACEMDDQVLIFDDDNENDNNSEDTMEICGDNANYEKEFEAYQRIEAESRENLENLDILDINAHRTVNGLSQRSWQRLPRTSHTKPFSNLHMATRNLRETNRTENDTLYPPERRPPIFDFFTVLTAFITAVILAYYTISSY